VEKYKIECYSRTNISYLSYPLEYLFDNVSLMDNFIKILPESYDIKSYERDEITGQWSLIFDETS
jgi:hypothetical protein